MRRLWLAVAIGLGLGAGGCSSGVEKVATGRGQEVAPSTSSVAGTSTSTSSARPDSTPPTEPSTTTASKPGVPVSPTSMPAGDALAPEEAARLLRAAGQLPVPDEVRDCVVAGIAADPLASADLRAAAEDPAAVSKGAGSLVMGLADGCMRSQVWLPSLLGGLEGQVRGGLSDDQSACVTDALKAAPALVDGVVGDSLAVGASRRTRLGWRSC